MHQHKVTLTSRLSGIAGVAPGNSDSSLRPASAKTQAAPSPHAPSVPATALDALALQKLTAELRSLAHDIQARNQQTLADIARLSVELGTVIAERLLATEIGAGRQRLDRIVAAALERVPAARSIAVRGHPDDLALLERQLVEQGDAELCRDALSYRRDETCRRGQIRLETDELFIAWDTQRCLSELRVSLLEQVYPDAESL